MSSQSRPWLHILHDDEYYTVGFTSRGLPRNAHSAAGRIQLSAYDSFNPCHYTGDDEAHVAECRKALAEALQVDESRLIVPRQTHSVNVLTLDDSFLPADAGRLEDVDALVTSMSDLVIGVSTADCLPVVVVDRNAGVAGVAHAGWRGAVGGIVDRLLDEMSAAGASAEDCHAYFGPAICPECFEVGDEVAVRFPQSCVITGFAKPHVDLPGFAAERLVAAGVPKGNIMSFDSSLCTRCHPDLFFSARASGIASGRNFTFVRLKNRSLE